MVTQRGVDETSLADRHDGEYDAHEDQSISSRAFCQENQSDWRRVAISRMCATFFRLALLFPAKREIRVKRGDSEVVRRIDDPAELRRVTRYARSRVGRDLCRWCDEDDLVQESILHAIESAKSRGAPGSIESRDVARRLTGEVLHQTRSFRAELRHQERFGLAMAIGVEPILDEVLPASILGVRLTPEEHQLAQLKIEERRWDEIARRLGTTVCSLWKRWERLKRRFKASRISPLPNLPSPKSPRSPHAEQPLVREVTAASEALAARSRAQPETDCRQGEARTDQPAPTSFQCATPNGSIRMNSDQEPCSSDSGGKGPLPASST